MNPRKIRYYGPDDQHTVTKIVVGTTLNPEPEYLEALIREIERARGARDGARDRRIEGMIQWVQALNPARGRSLRAAWGSRRKTSRNAA